MTTTVTKTIGTGGDYTTFAAWIAACPADLTAVDQIWRGEAKNQAFTATAGNDLAIISGITADATRYVELTTQAGASFSDNASVQTNALRFNSSNGASLSTSGSYARPCSVSVPFTRVSKLQFATTGLSYPLNVSAGGGRIDRCICEASSGIQAASYQPTDGRVVNVSNTLHVQRFSGAAAIVLCLNTTEHYNCTYAVPSDLTKATNAFTSAYAPMTMQNCAVFGATGMFSSGTKTVTTSITDIASPPSGFTTVAYDTTTGSGFQNITDATRDFRIKSTSALIDVGTTDATNAAVDIAGTARPSGAAYDVGCWELVAAGGFFARAYYDAHIGGQGV